MRIFFDTEFIDDGRTIDLISIGLVREDGLALYRESSECDLSKAGPWAQANVLPHLDGFVRPREHIAEQIKMIVGDGPEFWAYYADYDWVALCQLYGTIMDLPPGWPIYCRGIKQLCDSVGNPRLPPSSPAKHHALADAKWSKKAFEFLVSIMKARPDA